MKYKLVPVAAAVFAALTTVNATAVELPTDVLASGWSINGYASMNYRLVEGETTDNEYGKPDYKTAGTHGKSTNQVEFTIKKKTEHRNGVWSEFVVRTEYGNGNSYAYSSPGSQKKNDEAQLEIKESYVELGGLDFLGEDTSIWGGQRYLNRAAGLLSGEYWKQSSGLGAGIQTKIDGHTTGIALVTADPDAGDVTRSADRSTLTSLDFYFYDVKALGGSFNFDAKAMKQANNDNDGFGLSVSYNRDYYGLDGWSTTALNYGQGLAQNRGVNFGQWNDGDDNAKSIFFTSYGVLNISDKWQLGTEVTYMAAIDELFGAEDLKRSLIAVRPSYKINENLRAEMTVSWGHEEGKEGYFGGRTGDAVKGDYLNVELATVFTVNADYFGRPQIKPYISYVRADDDASAAVININSGNDEFVVGVHTEIWF